MRSQKLTLHPGENYALFWLCVRLSGNCGAKLASSYPRFLHRKKTLHLTEHGNLVADLNPRSRPISGEEFAKLWRERRPLDKATAEEVLRNIRQTLKADALSD
jgi:hypothetical protein